MSKYIEDKKIFELIGELQKNDKSSDYYVLGDVAYMINEIPRADVQPINSWISVEDRLPEDTKTVLVWYTSNTLFGLSEGYGLSWYSPTAKWYKNELNGENIAVLYWQPLSEPPKED